MDKTWLKNWMTCARRIAAFGVVMGLAIVISLWSGSDCFGQRSSGALDDLFLQGLEQEMETNEFEQLKTSVSTSVMEDLKVGADVIFDKPTGSNYDREAAERKKEQAWPMQANGLVSEEDLQTIVREVTKMVGKTEALATIHDLNASTDKETMAQWWDRVADCSGFCSQVVKQYYSLHLIRESRADHYIILFPINIHRVDYYKYGQLFREIARKLQSNPSLHVILEGRASRIGDRVYNRDLSERRGDSVRDALLDAGVPSHKIKNFHYGYEPPTITDDVRRLLRLDESEVRYSNMEYADINLLNQSVMIVLFERS